MVFHLAGLRSVQLGVYSSANRRPCSKAHRIGDISQIVTFFIGSSALPVFEFPCSRVEKHFPVTRRNKRLVAGKPVAAVGRVETRRSGETSLLDL
jgi:hypothetical protein